MKRFSGSLSTTVVLKSGEEADVEVEYSYSPATPDVWYLPNGDPGYPGDPEEAEVLSIKSNGRVLDENEIDEEVFEALVERCCEAGRDEIEAKYAAMDAAMDADYD